MSFFHNSKQSAQCCFEVTAAWADAGPATNFLDDRAATAVGGLPRSSAGVPALGATDADSAGKEPAA